MDIDGGNDTANQRRRGNAIGVELLQSGDCPASHARYGSIGARFLLFCEGRNPGGFILLVFVDESEWPHPKDPDGFTVWAAIATL